jgi:hypothetical protein
MKRVIMAAALLVSTASVFATETKGEVSSKENRKEVKVEQERVECSVSLSAKIGPSYAQIEVKCTYTATTCKEAIAGVNKCLDEARKAIQ